MLYELAWAAGLFEGEGTVYVSYDRRWPDTPSFYAAVRMTDEDSVRRFQTAVSTGKVYGPYPNGLRRNGLPTKPVWVWQVNSFEKVQAIIAMLWPGLGERRRAQATAVLTV